MTVEERIPGCENQNFLDRLHIGTHNVQGINVALKYRNWIEYCNKNEIHIISMTETKIAESSNYKLYLANPYYDVYTANSNDEVINKQESSMGTMIAVKKTIQPFIHNIMSSPGTAVAIDFFFPLNQRIRIISVYMPNNNNELKQATCKKIKEWMRQAMTKNYEIIILGDFNHDRVRDRKKPMMLFNEMEQVGMVSLMKYFDKKEETWSREGKKSQIDDIYVSNNMLIVITAPKIVNVEEITNSDHRMIVTEWQMNARVKKYRAKKEKAANLPVWRNE